MTNPLLDFTNLPHFSTIQPDQVEPALDQILAHNRQQINDLLGKIPAAEMTWNNIIKPLDILDNQLSLMWSPVSHLNSVMNSTELSDIYNRCLPKLSNYTTEMGQNKALFKAYQTILNNDPNLNQAQKKSLENGLKAFQLSGIDLSPEKQQQYKELSEKLSQLTNDYSQNVLKATNEWSKLITDKADLKGLPDTALLSAAQTAKQRDQEGWLLTLDFPSYHAVISYADDRALRQEIYTAFATRASDQAPSDPQWDNSQNMNDILNYRQQKARLLGFENYAEYSIFQKMAENSTEVMDFLTNLVKKSHQQAKQELTELETFAKTQGVTEPLAAWDINYYSEKLRHHQFDINQETLRPWFPLNRVIDGLFQIVEKLYGIRIEEKTGVEVWHPDVRFYQIFDADQQLRGQFYFDLFARQNKRGGAWMDECKVRMMYPDFEQIPVAYLTCNFTAPIGDQPSLLTHNEVETLFHEFGHGLHHLLTKVDYPAVSGINGVVWDAVELPSQFMENWCWEKEALDLISGHIETGEPLPAELFQKMKNAKHFQAAMMMVRQLEFSLFDLQIHLQDIQNNAQIYTILNQIRATTSVIKTPDFNRFAHAFSHIFAGGYAAGYYSYKWAEVLSADAFSLFEEKGLFDQTTGQLFLTEILEKGGSKDAGELFQNFRGRPPEINALLRHNGIK